MQQGLLEDSEGDPSELLEHFGQWLTGPSAPTTNGTPSQVMK